MPLDISEFEALIARLALNPSFHSSVDDDSFNDCFTTDEDADFFSITLSQFLDPTRNTQFLDPSRKTHTRKMANILLRSRLTSSASLSSETLTTIYSNLITSLRREPNLIRAKMLCHTISVIASTLPRDALVSLSDFLVEWVASDNTTHQILSFAIYAQLTDEVAEPLLPSLQIYLPEVHRFLAAAAPLDVAIAAIDAIIKFISVLSASFVHGSWSALPALMMATLTKALLFDDHMISAQKVLLLLIKLAEVAPLYLCDHGVGVNAMLEIAMREDYGAGIRRLAFEFIVTLFEAGKLDTRMVPHRQNPNLFRVLVTNLLLDNEIDPVMNDEVAQIHYFSFRQGCLDRLSSSLNSGVIMLILSTLLPTYMEASKCPLLLLALALIADASMEVSESHLDEKQVRSIVDFIKQVVPACSSMKYERAERTQEEEFVAEESKLLKEGDEHKLLYQVVGEKIDGKARWSKVLQVENKTSEKRRMAVCIFNNIAKHCREKALESYDSFLPFLLEACNDEFLDIRQEAVYGVGVCSEYGGSFFKPFVEEAVRSSNALDSANEMAHGRALTALRKIREFHQNSLTEAHVPRPQTDPCTNPVPEAQSLPRPQTDPCTNPAPEAQSLPRPQTDPCTNPVPEAQSLPRPQSLPNILAPEAKSLPQPHRFLSIPPFREQDDHHPNRVDAVSEGNRVDEHWIDFSKIASEADSHHEHERDASEVVDEGIKVTGTNRGGSKSRKENMIESFVSPRVQIFFTMCSYLFNIMSPIGSPLAIYENGRNADRVKIDLGDMFLLTIPIIAFHGIVFVCSYFAYWAVSPMRAHYRLLIAAVLLLSYLSSLFGLYAGIFRFEVLIPSDVGYLLNAGWIILPLALLLLGMVSGCLYLCFFCCERRQVNSTDSHSHSD